MKHKLNYTVEVGSKLTTLLIFFYSQNQRALDGYEKLNSCHVFYSSWKFRVCMRCSLAAQSEIIEVFNQRTIK